MTSRIRVGDMMASINPPGLLGIVVSVRDDGRYVTVSWINHERPMAMYGYAERDARLRRAEWLMLVDEARP